MIHIEHFVFNSFQTNCHILWDDNGKCAITDPGCHSDEETSRVTGFISSKGLDPVCILLTHCHFDHIYGTAALAEKYGIPVYAGAGETATIEHTNPQMCSFFGYTLPDPFVITPVGDAVDAGSLHFEVLQTPGHTTAGVCFLERAGKILISGDTLFAGSIGRTDHPGGDYDILMHSIFSQLMCLEGDIRVLPGHGPATDIATERMTNPFLMPFNEPYEE